MPTYEYACKSCGEHLEVVQSFSDDALTECPACQGELRKVYSAAGIIFKGSGWHIKDYKSGGGADPGPPDTSSDGDSGSSKKDDRPPSKDAAKKDTPKKDAAKSDTPKKDTPKKSSKASSSTGSD